MRGRGPGRPGRAGGPRRAREPPLTGDRRPATYRLLAVARGRTVRVAFVVVAVSFGAAFVVARREAVGDALATIGLVPALLAVLCVCGALASAMQVWRVFVGGLGSPVPARAAAQVVFVGQLGKYLPGSVWPVLAQMELGASHGVPRTRAATATVMMMPISLLTGLLVGAASLPFQAGGVRHFAWAFLAVPLVLVALHPAVLNRLLTLAMRVLRRPADELVVRGHDVVVAAAWGLLSWVLYGAQVWLLVLPLGGGGLRSAAIAVGAFAFAWSAGFVVVVAPAGAGVREVVLVALLAPVVGTSGAAAVALLSRVVLTVADLLTAGTGAWLGRRTLGALAERSPAPEA